MSRKDNYFRRYVALGEFSFKQFLSKRSFLTAMYINEYFSDCHFWRIFIEGGKMQKKKKNSGTNSTGLAQFMATYCWWSNVSKVFCEVSWYIFFDDKSEWAVLKKKMNALKISKSSSENHLCHFGYASLCNVWLPYRLNGKKIFATKTQEN